MSNEQHKPEAARRKFLTGAAAATAGAATLGFPMIAKSQSPIVIKMQGSWSATDIFNEMAQEFVTRVNAMSGVDWSRSWVALAPRSFAPPPSSTATISTGAPPVSL